MKFVFVAQRFHTNQHVVGKALRLAGHEVSFIVMRVGQSERYDVISPVVVGVSDRTRRLAGRLNATKANAFIIERGLPPVGRFWTEMRLQRPDAVVVRDPATAFGRLAVLCAKALGAKTVLYTQGPQYVSALTLRDRLRPLMAHIVGGSWMTPVLYRGAVQPPFRAPGLEFVPFPMEPHAVQPSTRRDPSYRKLLSVGKFQVRKNHHTVIDILAASPWRTKATLTIVGEASAPEHHDYVSRLQNQVARLGLSEQVQFLLNVPAAEMGSVYREHDILLLAAEREPAAVCVLEAMSYGLAVVSTQDNGTSSYVGHRGVVVDFQSHAAAMRGVELCWDIERVPYVAYGMQEYVSSIEGLLE